MHPAAFMAVWSGSTCTTEDATQNSLDGEQVYNGKVGA
jgi:hypothetical protein